jgi:hypothetical protein
MKPSLVAVSFVGTPRLLATSATNIRTTAPLIGPPLASRCGSFGVVGAGVVGLVPRAANVQRWQGD